MTFVKCLFLCSILKHAFSVRVSFVQSVMTDHTHIFLVTNWHQSECIMTSETELRETFCGLVFNKISLIIRNCRFNHIGGQISR